jgi:hypothetical protein
MLIERATNAADSSTTEAGVPTIPSLTKPTSSGLPTMIRITGVRYSSPPVNIGISPRGVLVRLNETAWAFLPDCLTSGMVDVAYAPYNSGAGRMIKVGMMFVLGSIAASVLAII